MTGAAGGDEPDPEVVVVGGRCGGAPLAMLLARAGVRVTVLDKARLPSDTASTHIVSPRGAAVLDRLGVLDAVLAAGAVPIRGVLLQYGDARLEVDYASDEAGARMSTGRRPGLSLRRAALDGALLDAARSAGADVRPGTAVTGLTYDRAQRVNGVRTTAGPLRCRLVVGADGRSSTVAALTGAATYARYDAPRFAAWGYYRTAGNDGGRLRIGRTGRTALISVPADDGLHLVGVIPPMAVRDEFLADRDRHFAAALDQWPELRDVVGDAQREGPLRIVPHWQAYLRRSAGAGWALLADAGNFKDPSAAQGITDALGQAESMAAVVIAGLAAENRTLDAGLHAWWRRRDAECRDMHWFARDIGAPGPTRPALTALVRRLGDSPDRVVFAQVLNRDVPSSAVLTAARLARAAADAARDPRRLPALAAELGELARSRATRLARDRPGR